jgi:NADPH:quinone reductase-like Zn-dependent oxidoreductase
MKKRYWILIGMGALLATGIATLLTVTSHDHACPALSAVPTGTDTMRAARKYCYGVPRGIRVETVARPVPGDGQVLIKVRAASINPMEWYRIAGQPYLTRLRGGIGSPKEPRVGYDMAGTVEVVGPHVTQFKVGDAVFGGVRGALAEYALGQENGDIVVKPANLSFEEAAGIPVAASAALQGLRDSGHLKAGQKVLINGASGGVGTYAVQIAKALGAEVTGVCSTTDMALVRSLGADHVIDYTREDFTRNDVRYDVILDNVGNHSYTDLADVTTPAGYIVTVGASRGNAWVGPLARVALSRTAAGLVVDPHLPLLMSSVNKQDLEVLANLAREGKVRTVIDRRYPLAQLAEALTYLGGQRARGKVIITVP